MCETGLRCSISYQYISFFMLCAVSEALHLLFRERAGLLLSFALIIMRSNDRQRDKSKDTLVVTLKACKKIP